MIHVRLGGVLTIALGTLSTSWSQAPPPRPRENPEPTRARPAVLILRVAEVPAAGSRARRFEVVQPRGFRSLPFAEDGSLPLSEEGVPDLGAGFELVRTCAPAPDARDVRYYVYHADLADSATVRNWEEFQRAQRRQARQSRAEEFNDRAWVARKEQLLAAHEQATREGIDLLRAGQYRAAVISLTRAAELNHGDPVCRIHLAQARVALGHDVEAAAALRRALQLQPKLVPMQLALEEYYPHEEDFLIQVDALGHRIGANPKATPDEYLLLGFMAFQCGWFDEAHAAFQKAAQRQPKDRLIQSYLALTKPPRS